MNTPSIFAMAAYFALKRAWREAVVKAGGCVQAAKDLRIDAARVSRCGAPHESMYPPLDAVADIEALAGEPVITAALADLAGYVLVRKVSSNPQTGCDFTDEAMRLMSEMTSIIQQLVQANADHKVDPKEAAGMLPGVRILEQHVANLRATLEAIEAS